MPTIWFAGHVIPANDPEASEVGFETRIEALTRTVEGLRAVAYDRSVDDDSTVHVLAAVYEQAADALEGLDDKATGDWSARFEDGQVLFWFEPIEMAEDEAAEALERATTEY